MTEENTYTTKRGRKIKLINIQGLLDGFYTSHQEPDPPEYEVQIYGGGTERHSLADVKDRDSLNDDERAQLSEYDQKLAQFNEKTAAEFTNLILQRGIDIGDDEDKWAREQEQQFGIHVPSDPVERRKHYIKTEVLYGTPEEIQDDIAAIISGVLEASGVPKEKLAELDHLFRSAMGRRVENGDTHRQSTHPKRQMVVPVKVRTGKNRFPYGKVSKRVGRSKRK